MKSVSYIRYSILIVISLFLFCEKDYLYLKPGTIATGNVTFTSRDGYRKTTYFTVSIPKEYPAKKQLPMIIALHQNGGNAKSVNQLLLSIADSLGYVVLAPQGEDWVEAEKGWNWGRNAQKSIFSSFNVLIKKSNVDRERLYVIGIGKGGEVASDLCMNHPSLFGGAALIDAQPPNCILDWKNRNVFKNFKLYVSYAPVDWNTWEYLNIKDELQQQGLYLKFKPSEEIRDGSTYLPKLNLIEILNFLDK